jgi:hypothetical protein
MSRKDGQEKEEEKRKVRTMRTMKASLQDKVASLKDFE